MGFMKTLEKKINFLVVGTAKAGTTSLFHSIKNHPKIFIPEQKEMNFFNSDHFDTKIGATDKFTDDYNYRPAPIKDVEEYLKFYKGIDNDIMCGDITPTYLYNYKYSIPAIKKHCSEDVKIIIILRNPVDRTYSHYFHSIREGWEKYPFFKAINSEEERLKKNYSYRYSYKEYGNYFKQVKAFQENFQNVKIYFFEELFTDEFYNDFFNFIDVSPIKISKTEKMNSTGLPKSKIIQRFLDLCRSNKKVVKFFKKLGFEPIYLKIKYSNLKKPTMDSKSKIFLKNYFKSDLMKLEKLLGKNFSHWYS